MIHSLSGLLQMRIQVMPELPEVQTVVDGLKPYLVGKSIKSLQFSGYRLRFPYPKDLSDRILEKIKETEV